VSDLKDILVETLDEQRRHVLGILEGLSDEELRRPVLPSGWSCLGMVKHLALGVEHYWFRCIIAGESLDFYALNALDNDRDWEVGPKETGAEVFNLYRDEIERANAIIMATPLDTPATQRDGWWGTWEVPRPIDLEFIAFHVITETACHAGHLDAARELLDGRQWMAS
jgi:hypothetical protein